MLRTIIMSALTATTLLAMIGGLWAAGDPAAEKAAADARQRAAAEAAEKAKIDRYVAAAKAADPAAGKAVADAWAKLRDQPLDAENDFILDSLAERYPRLGDALDLIDGGAYSNAARRLSDLLAGRDNTDPYLVAHAKFLLARIKFSEGDWAGAAREFEELLRTDAERMTLESEAYYYQNRALANVAPTKEERLAVAKRFADFGRRYPFAKQRLLAAANDLAREVDKTLPVVRGSSLTNITGGPEELPNFAKDLRNLETRIAKSRDTGGTTQKLQEEALAYLDNLIEKAEQQQNQQQQQQNKDDQDEKEKKPQKNQQNPDQQDQKDQKDQNQPQEKDDPKSQPKSATDPRKNSQLPGKATGRNRLKDLEALRRGNFGVLPPEEVQKILLEALKNGQIPPKYAEALRLYDEELGRKINSAQPKK